ncbi:MAG: polyprenyl synthetase family protein [Gaiellaceae bacterium MAG52_C11]|nr:polyprenyl synthetase family protein [Candidatus Gaiellasilicea maunaloa]
MSALAASSRSYLGEVEARLHEAVAAYPGLVRLVGSEAVEAGGKRLRPLLIQLVSDDHERALRSSVAVELVHTASLIHDDLIDRAPLRRGSPTAWHAHGDGAARTTGDYLFSRGFAVLAEAGDLDGVRVLADACLALSRGEALQKRQQHDPATTVEAYLERIALKTGKLFEAACLLGSRDPSLGRFGLKLGIAFQIADDILDCAGDSTETGKVAGTDLREGTPTLPLLLAARADEVVRVALAGGPTAGVLVRVAATGALERSRELARDYVRQARESLNGVPRRDELEALAEAVVDRKV